MTDLTNIFARSIKDLTLLPQLPDDLTVLDQVKVPVGNLPVGVNGCEALTVKQIKDLATIDLESKKANKIDVEVALSNLRTTANKFYPTLSEANNHLATMSVNDVVTIGEEANKGLWYKATANATTLTKSAYDPLTQANNYTNNKSSTTKAEAVALANKYTNLVFDAVPATIAPYVAQAEAAATAATISAGVFETPEAGVDPTTGVKGGKYFNVRSPSSNSYIDEYQNIGGVATPSGKSYPSAAYVQNVAKHTALPFVVGKTYSLNERVQLTNGDIVKSTIDGNTNDPNVDMTGWVKTNSAGQIFDASGLSQQVINDSNLTVFNFGAKGDGATDDSDAFQAYINSALTPKNVYCGQRKAVFLIKKTVDFKGKGLVGGGFGAQNSADYALSSIMVKPDFVGTDVFINVKSTIKDLNMVQEIPTNTVNGIQFDPFNISIDNVNMRGFGLQTYSKVACVALRVTNFTSIDAKSFAIQIQDKVTAQSTTAYFRNCSFQWGEGAIDFADNGQCYGSSFENIILEYMRTGITGGLFSKCRFDDIWAEQTIDHVQRPWLKNSIPQQMTDNTLGIIKLQGDWTNPYLPTGLCSADNFGGIVTDNGLLGIQNNTGGGIVIDLKGVRTRHHPYAENRALVITTQDTAPESGYKTPLEVNAPNGELYFGNYSKLDYTPVKFKRVVAKKKDANEPYYGYDELSALGFVGEAYNPTNGKNGVFQAPMFLTWDGGSAIGATNAGWKLTKISTGHYRILRDADNALELINPNLLVSGILSSAFLLHRCSVINSYDGSWSNYRAAAGFNIYFQTSAGASADPERFTVAFTLR